MKIGICLPYMKAGLSREDYQAWFKAVDAGPFHSLCCGERIHGPAMDMRMVLAAAAMATTRVEISPTLYVLPMHSATRVAKEIASGLGISIWTVHGHVKNIFEKLNVHTRTEAVVKFLQK